MKFKIVLLFTLLVFLASCIRYESQAPKAISYIILDSPLLSQEIIEKLDVVAVELGYKNTVHQVIDSKESDVKLHHRIYTKRNNSMSFFFDNLSGLRCITLGIYTEMNKEEANEELARIKATFLKKNPFLVYTTENCVNIENNVSIFDI